MYGSTMMYLSATLVANTYTGKGGFVSHVEYENEKLLIDKSNMLAMSVAYWF